MAYSIPSYRQVLHELEDRPNSIAVYFDSEIELLLADLPRNAKLLPTLMGETLFRAWLYSGSDIGEAFYKQAIKTVSPDLIASYTKYLLNRSVSIRRESLSTRDIQPENLGIRGDDAHTWAYILERIKNFCCADCFVPVVNLAGHSESILLPFNIEKSYGSTIEVLDQNGQDIVNWSQSLGSTSHLFAYLPRIILSCDVGKRTEFLTGNSMLLPIYMAIAKKTGHLPEYSKWDVISTGCLSAIGTVTQVDGVRAKADAAIRAGAKLLIYPNGEDNIETIQSIQIPTNLSLSACLKFVDEAITDRGLTRLTPKQSLTKLVELQKDIHTGLVQLVAAGTRLQQYEKLLEVGNQEADYVREGKAVALLIHGAIANHSGKPDQAKGFLEKAIIIIKQYDLDLEVHYHAIANMVVSLTDLGLLETAEKEGRDLLDLVQNMRGNADVKMAVRMTANGVLGGQPLLQKRLQATDDSEEALDLLEKAYQHAQELEDPKEQARDAVQIALWHALVKPDTAGAELDKAQALLEALHTHGESSLPFLQCYRFLAGYRHLILNHKLMPEYEMWPLPEGGPNWLTSLALKYRGTLHAEAGNIDAAENDFSQASGNLFSEKGPLLRFIGATTALQAAQSLNQAQPEKSITFAKRALEEINETQTVLHGIHRDPLWWESAQAIIDSNAIIASPQKYYRY